MKFPVEKMCAVLKISKSSYYRWLNTGPTRTWLKNEHIRNLICDIFNRSFESYGAPRIKKELKEYGYDVSRRKISRIMKVNHLYVRRTRKFRYITDCNHNYPIAPNFLNQNFDVDRKNQVWVSDMTFIKTRQGWVYLTVIIDLFNRKIVGWAMSDDLNTENTIIPAWNMAVDNNKIDQELIFHSDRGSQYASYKFMSVIKQYNGLIKQSMSRKGNCWDNAVAESFFKSLKVEWVYRNDYAVKSEAKISIFQWIETWYNKRRRHSYLGNKTIDEFELEIIHQNLVA